MPPLMNPAVTDFLARVARHLPDEIALGDAIELARMVRNGDLIFVDAIPAWIAAQEQSQMRDDFVDACRRGEGDFVSFNEVPEPKAYVGEVL